MIFKIQKTQWLPSLAGLTLLGFATHTRAADYDYDVMPRHLGIISQYAQSILPDNDEDLTASLLVGAAVGHFGTGDFTVSHWFSTNFSEPGRLADVIGNRTSIGHGNFFAVRMRGDGIISLELDEDENGTNYASAVAEGHPVNDGCWHHLTYVRADQVIGVYIDGVPVAAGVAPHPARIDGGNAFRIGRSLGAFSNFASIAADYDGVQVFTRALRYNEIQQLASLPSAPDEYSAIDRCANAEPRE